MMHCHDNCRIVKHVHHCICGDGIPTIEGETIVASIDVVGPQIGKDEMVAASAAANPGAKSKALTVNPKDLFGAVKVDVTKVPAIAILHEAMAMMDGADKYGPYNWRDKPVIASIYVAACHRHVDLWWEGFLFAPDSRAHHLGHGRACLGILLDAEANGVLVDDRPIKNKPEYVPTTFEEMLDEMSYILKKRVKFKREGAEAYDAQAAGSQEPHHLECPYEGGEHPFEENYWKRGYEQRKSEATR